MNKMVLLGLWTSFLFIFMSSLVNTTPETSTVGLDLLINDVRMPPDYVTKDGYAIRDLIAHEPTSTETSLFMIRDTSVAIILMESNGSIDPNLEDWDEVRKNQVISEIQAALDWWAEKDPYTFVTWTYHVYTVPTSYEPITHLSTEEHLWVNEAMAYFGYTSDDYFTYKVRDFDDDLRKSDGTDWAFTIFVVDSLNDVDGKFEDGWFAWAFGSPSNPGPLMAMTYDNGGYTIDRMDAVAAHEIGHIFGAADEYTGAYHCDEHSDCYECYGYLHVENQNCMQGCLINVPCIMKDPIFAFTNGDLCEYTRGQVGWRDEDGDNILDAIDSDYNPDTDTDGDGIVDYWDNCPNRPGIPERMGCPARRRGGGCRGCYLR